MKLIYGNRYKIGQLVNYRDIEFITDIKNNEWVNVLYTNKFITTWYKKPTITTLDFQKGEKHSLYSDIFT